MRHLTWLIGSLLAFQSLLGSTQAAPASRFAIASASIPQRRHPRSPYSPQALRRTIPAHSRTAPAPIDEPPPLTYADLSPAGRLIAGTVEVAVSTVLEYISGFLGGYALGTITDLPRLLFRPIESAEATTWMQQASGRFARMHQKSATWAKSWAGVSAVLGGMRVATKVIRGGTEDEWNTVLSSMAAGAFFARNEGPQAMLKGAVIYGGIVYLLYGGAMGKKQPFQYKEQPIEF